MTRFVLFCSLSVRLSIDIASLFILANLIYFILFYFVLFCFILFYFILFCFVLFCFVLFCFILFYFVLLCFILFYFKLDSEGRKNLDDRGGGFFL